MHSLNPLSLGDVDQSYGEYWLYDYGYKYYVGVRVRVGDRILYYYMSASTSTGWWARVQVWVPVSNITSIFSFLKRDV